MNPEGLPIVPVARALAVAGGVVAVAAADRVAVLRAGTVAVGRGGVPVSVGGRVVVAGALDVVGAGPAPVVAAGGALVAVVPPLQAVMKVRSKSRASQVAGCARRRPIVIRG